MLNTPLHPAVVHVPLGLAFVTPLFALGFTIATWRGTRIKRGWMLIVIMQVIIAVGGLIALRTGIEDEGRVERVIAERIIDEHEELGEQFVWIEVIALAISAIVLALPQRAVRWGVVGATMMSIVVGLFAFRTGHSGGELVYVRGAAVAHPYYQAPGRGSETK